MPSSPAGTWNNAVGSLFSNSEPQKFQHLHHGAPSMPRVQPELGVQIARRWRSSDSLWVDTRKMAHSSHYRQIQISPKLEWEKFPALENFLKRLWVSSWPKDKARKTDNGAREKVFVYVYVCVYIKKEYFCLTSHLLLHPHQQLPSTYFVQSALDE